MGERWLAHCHQQVFNQGADDQVRAVVLSLGAVLLRFLGSLEMPRDISDHHD